MAVRSIRFQNAQGRTLGGRLQLPDERPPLAWAIFAHCFTCSKDYKAPVYTARALALRGLGVLRFDFTGLGDSEGDFADTTFSTNVSDVLSAARWLAEEHAAPTVLVGHSMGGAAVLVAARELPDVRVVATIAAPSEPGHVGASLGDVRARALAEGQATAHIAGRDVLLRRRFFEELDGVRLGDVIRHVDASFLFFHSPADPVVPVSSASRLFQAARHPKSFIALPDGDHLLTNEADARLVADVIAAWVRRHLTA